MADLSKVLGDVYATADRPEAARFVSAARQQAPEWSDESRLDAAFADWTPGPPSDAPARERAMFDTSTAPVPSEGSGPLALDDDLAAALSQALAEAPPLDNDLFDQDTAPEVAPSAAVTPLASVAAPAPAAPDAPEVVPVETPRVGSAALAYEVDAPVSPEPSVNRLAWNRSDDDVLPPGSRRRGLAFSLRRK
jgi:hypothetical protein